MAFCKFSTEHNSSNSITLDNAFVNDYLPFAPDSCTKVYLYGLLKCQDCNSVTNTLQDFAQELSMEQEDVKSAFYYWHEQGLVVVLNVNPIEVRYLPVKAKKYNAKMFDEKQYSSFNRSLQEIIDGRMITPFEYKEYYNTMVSLHIEEDAMLMIAKYCTLAKGNDVGYKYVLTVAKNWAYDGVHTVQDVENKMHENDLADTEIRDVLKALKSVRQPNFEDRQKFIVWTKQYGYDLPTIIQIAKQTKKGGIEKLDQKLQDYKQKNLFSIEEITNYENNKEELFEIAKQTCKALGIYYQNHEPVVNNYILKWNQMGFDNQSILLIAKICFKKFVRTLEDMENIVNKYYAKGLISVDSINDYINETLSIDKDIKKILEKLDLTRQVTSWDRDFYNTWANVWKFSAEMIDYAVSLAVGKTQPMQYINKILSNFKEQNVFTIDKAQQKPSTQVVVKDKKPEFMTHSFSSEELNALFDNLDEVKLS